MDYAYERREIERVLTEVTDADDRNYRVKVTAPTGAETRWLSITREQLRALRDAAFPEVSS